MDKNKEPNSLTWQQKELYASKEVKENALASEGISRRPEIQKPQKINKGVMTMTMTITFAHSKQNTPEHNLLARKKSILEQAAFWHEVKVV